METKTAEGYEEVVRHLISYIKDKNLHVGDRLPSVRQIASDLGLRTNVARDGILHAQTMGLVKIHPRAGAFVQSLNYDRLVDVLGETIETALALEGINLIALWDARCLIEVEAAMLAATRRYQEDLVPLHEALLKMRDCGDDRHAYVKADENFHLGIAQIAGNQAFVVILRALLTMLRPFRISQMPATEWSKDAESMHQMVYRHICNCDAEAAATTMREHLQTRRKALVAGAIDHQQRTSRED